MKVSRFKTLFSLAAVAGLSMTGSTLAALTVTTTPAPAGTAFDAGAAIVTNASDPNGTGVAGQYISPGTALVQTITPTSAITLDHVEFFTTGQGGGVVRFGVFAIPSFGGGKESDGYVNTSFSNNLLGGGAGLNATLFGSAGTPPTLNKFTLSGADQVTLNAGTVYAIEFELVSGSSVQILKSAANLATSNTYSAGASYQGASEYNFNGAAPANGRGERDQYVPGTDNLLAVYSTPEPASLAVLGLGGLGLLRRKSRA